MRDQERDPGQEPKDGGEVDKVAKDRLGIVCDVHESGAAEESGNGQGRNGYTALVRPAEDLGSVTLLGKSVNRAGCNVQIRVGSTKGEEQDARIQNPGQMLDAGKFDGKHKRRGGGTGPGTVGEGKIRRVVGNEHAQEKDGQAVEEQDAVEGELDRTGDGLAGVLCLADGDTNQLRTEIGEDGVDQRSPEAEEFALVTGAIGGFKGSGVLVVLEASRWAWTGTHG